MTGLLTIDGDYDQDAGGALAVLIGGVHPVVDYSQVHVGGAADLEGQLDVSLATGFELRGAETFDLVETVGGLTNDLSSLTLDGEACSALGGQIYRCAVDGGFDTIALLATDPLGATDLTLKVVATPEPSTWALMALGFAGLAWAGARRPRKAAAEAA